MPVRSLALQSRVDNPQLHRPRRAKLLTRSEATYVSLAECDSTSRGPPFFRMVAARRHLHAHPELSGQEHDTSLYLYRKLAECGFSVRIGPESRGVIADHHDRCEKHSAALLAISADIDALRIQDQKTVDYHSQFHDVMHACGHDAHTAICLGTLLAMRDLARDDALPWPVHFRAILQPAEETCVSAQEMITAGAIEGIDAILALHMDPTRHVGRIGVGEGVLTANCDAMRV